MAKIFVADILPNQEVETLVVVAEKQLRTARNGTQFLTLKLIDRTGEIIGRVWENAGELADFITTKKVFLVTGRSEQYRDELQLQVSKISPVPAHAIEPSDFLPVCPISTEVIFEKLKESAALIRRRPLHRLLGHLLGDPEIMDRFKVAPAAKSMHHAYLGGLLEHTASVTALVSILCEHYPSLDRDLLIAGAILHDIGKIDEFVYDLCIDYSHAGRLLGHMVIGSEILDHMIRKLKAFPREETLLLKHLILSHHGESEFGAVKLPMTREAIVLHFADDLDAKMNSVSRILSDAKDGDLSWSSYQPLFERFFFKGFPSGLESSVVPTDKEESERRLQLSLWEQEKKLNG